MFALFEVAYKAGACGDGYMLTLNDLRMAARAPELFASFQVSEVNLVVKGSVFEFCLSFQEPFLMTSPAEAAFVRNFSPWL
jgi:hypothetical protein